MKRNRILGWLVTNSKKEAIEVLTEMLKRMELCDEDVDGVNMYITKEELQEKNK